MRVYEVNERGEVVRMYSGLSAVKAEQQIRKAIIASFSEARKEVMFHEIVSPDLLGRH